MLAAIVLVGLSFIQSSTPQPDPEALFACDELYFGINQEQNFALLIGDMAGSTNS